jgi:hypothetical protein
LEANANIDNLSYFCSKPNIFKILADHNKDMNNKYLYELINKCDHINKFLCIKILIDNGARMKITKLNILPTWLMYYYVEKTMFDKMRLEMEQFKENLIHQLFSPYGDGYQYAKNHFETLNKVS